MTRIRGVPSASGGPPEMSARPGHGATAVTGQAPGTAGPGHLGRIGAWCYDHRRIVLLGWIAAVIAIIAVASAAGSRFEDDFGGVGQSQQAQNILAQRFPAQAGDDAQVVFRSAAPIRTPAVTARIDRRSSNDRERTIARSSRAMTSIGSAVETNQGQRRLEFRPAGPPRMRRRHALTYRMQRLRCWSLADCGSAPAPTAERIFDSRGSAGRTRGGTRSR